jgi:hypothetical protein
MAIAAFSLAGYQFQCASWSAVAATSHLAEAVDVI